MLAFTDYQEAAIVARKRARATGLDCGIEKRKEYGKTIYIVRFLPKESHSFGCDLQAERVRPTDPID